ncbi:MAG: hypothetical protein HYT71_00700 [Candidatus Aenigmarchaeota archaeon]|nr:hypothetical protein [Candidatus Aenigmarchaeota archaeon]
MKKSKISKKFGLDELKKAAPLGAAVLVIIVLFFAYFYDFNPTVCKDSDRGANLYAKGTCRINGTSFVDSCSGISVKEYSCGADSSCVYSVFSCAQGSSCVNGACVGGTDKA